MKHLEVSDFGLVPGLGENFKTVLNQLRGSTTENCLLTKKVSFGLFGECGGDSTGTESPEAFGIGPGKVPSSTRCVILHSDDDGNTAASF